MQLPLSFAQEPADEVEPSQNVWQTVGNEQRSKTLGVLARLLAKTAVHNKAVRSPQQRKERDHD
jgi:hypothetical protein